MITIGPNFDRKLATGATRYDIENDTYIVQDGMLGAKWDIYIIKIAGSEKREKYGYIYTHTQYLMIHTS